MKILKIYKHSARKNKYIIEIEDNLSFELGTETLLKHGLRSGDEIEEKEIGEIRKEDEFINAKNSAYRLLAKRMRSEKELIDKLKAKKHSDETINKVLSGLGNLNLINDEEFSRKFISDSITLNRPLGKMALKFKLQKFGISKDLAARKVKDLLDEETEFNLALSAAQKKLSTLKRYPAEKQKVRIYSFLSQRGFNYDIVKKVLNKLNFNIDEEFKERE
jgi:regulatory protein